MYERLKALALPLITIIAVLLACGGSETTDSTEPEPAAVEGETAQQTGDVLLEVVVWDDTSNNPPGSRMEVWVKGHGSWYPDVKFGSEKRSLGSFPIGEPKEFFFYPDGRNGVEIKIPFEMTNEMISGSVMSLTQVTLYDDKVEVFGQAIPELEKEYSR